jgi:imidazoleglycerol-phosphate dehydratase
MAGERIASITRRTNETQVDLTLALDGSGEAEINTGIGFFDHMLHHVAHHGTCRSTRTTPSRTWPSA